MDIRLKKIGQVKATVFSKQFDRVYDYWKKRAEDDFNYFGELKFIKEHNQVFIYTIIQVEENKFINPEDWTEENSEEN